MANTEAQARRGESMRSRIVDAAEAMLIEQGARAATTRALAKAAGCAEGTLYVHFPDRPAIFAAVFEKRWPLAHQALNDLIDNVGQGDVVANVADTLAGIRDFMVALEPLIAAIKSDPAVAHAMQNRWRDMEAGPHQMVDGLVAYARAEQEAGRVAANVDVQSAAEALIGFIFYGLASSRFSRKATTPADTGRLRKLIAVNLGQGWGVADAAT